MAPAARPLARAVEQARTLSLLLNRRDGKAGHWHRQARDIGEIGEHYKDTRNKRDAGDPLRLPHFLGFFAAAADGVPPAPPVAGVLARDTSSLPGAPSAASLALRLGARFFGPAVASSPSSAPPASLVMSLVSVLQRRRISSTVRCRRGSREKARRGESEGGRVRKELRSAASRGARTHTLDEPVEAEGGELHNVALDALLLVEAVLGDLDEEEPVLVLRVRLALGLVGVDDLELRERVLDLVDALLDELPLAILRRAALLGLLDLGDVALPVCERTAAGTTSAKVSRESEGGTERESGRTVDLLVPLPEHLGVLADLVDRLGRHLCLDVDVVVAAVRLDAADEALELALGPVAEALAEELLLLLGLLLGERLGVVDRLLLGDALLLELLLGERRVDAQDGLLLALLLRAGKRGGSVERGSAAVEPRGARGGRLEREEGRTF